MIYLPAYLPTLYIEIKGVSSPAYFDFSSIALRGTSFTRQRRRCPHPACQTLRYYSQKRELY